MTRMTIPDSETSDHARALCSPVALAFVRIVMACRGVTEARARQIYLDYINGVRPEHAPAALD
ncbi:conserved hypothetical protein [Bradyrhizobium oligotrophicum S58]|uniref:Uncharacterized protein n=1 Tax=Bradyrhizobium oligotrophicum S58 TaxID=1245469 RepID=M4ZA34_9BRAD|nr:hypothetical protein [Bradyrhizobium oligotrophicum]BAM90708.1 conserved hypothetical protein [Bradyrhizobium oligotrophicum S58]